MPTVAKTEKTVKHLMDKFYLTTPIYYVNDVPHIGHAYTTIVADALARYFRMRKADVCFITGTDENSQKNVDAALKAGETNIQAYVDRMSAVWQETFDELGITNTDFIRTTEERHKIGVKKFWNRVWEAGDIYLGTYQGWYCVGCEAFKTETELIEGNCPLHKKPPQKIEEKNYFFRLTKYRDALLAHIDTHPDFVQPESRRNEIRSYIANFMEDISISRQGMEWGIPVPEMSNVNGQMSNVGHQAIYVWFDALINYLTAVGYGTDDKKFDRYWPADVHLVGKDIIKFHCAVWPAMLMAAGIPLPRKVFAHGFFTVEGTKMSKSLGNVVDPRKIAQEYDLDTLRYYLMRDIPFGEDGDFSMTRLQSRYDSELANELGNLVHRVLSMTEKYFDGVVPAKTDGHLNAWTLYDAAWEELKPHDAIAAAWTVIREANRFVELEAPWKLAKIDPERLGKVMYTLLETLRHVAWMLLPILPDTSQRMFAALGIADEIQETTYEDAKKWGGLKAGTKILKGEPLFPKKLKAES
ncbi:MAG: methionine--tRNA ligase [bacterium]|nr:methionine--tRNA ligase [bacterium]